MHLKPNVHVIPARSLPIETPALCHLRDIAYDIRRGATTEAEAEWLILAVGPLLDELIAHRNLAAGALPAETTVHQLPGAR